MKNIFRLALYVMVCVWSSPGVAQQWNSYTPTANFDVNTVAILKPGYIAIGGGRESNDSVQIMFATSNYGVTWNENPHDGLASWTKSMAFADTANGYAVGYQGRIISTNDGGRNWGFATYPTTRNIHKIVNVSPVLYYAVGGTESNSPVQTILKTTNFGASWNVIYDASGPCLKSVYFFDAVKGFAVGDSGVILATTNGGALWSPVAAPIQRNFNAITFINADTGFITGGELAGRSTILKTIDGGSNWTLLSDTTGGMLNDISFASVTEGYIVGDSASVLKTTDGGQTWLPLLIDAHLTGAETFRAVNFYNPSFGVIGGRAGKLYVYLGWPVDVFTLGAVVNDSTTAEVYSGINTYGYPSAISFTYSTDSTFNSFFSTPVQTVQTDSFSPGYAKLTGLAPNTWYYYFAHSGSNNGDTLRFYTGSSYPVFQTTGGNVIDSVTLQLNGRIHGIASVTNLQFEYGRTPLLGSVINASPAVVSDTTDHLISAVLNPVIPRTFYYYRLRGVAGADTVYGDIYFTGNPFKTLETLAAGYVTDSSAQLYGVEEGFSGAVTLSFEYGPLQGPVSETFPVLFSTGDSAHFFSYPVFGLQPGQLYTYRLKVQTGAGINYGKSIVFYTGLQDSVIQTLPAQNVTFSSATLEGMLNHFPDGAAISFEYGADTSLTNTLTATPATVSDTLYHKCSVSLTGVTTNLVYFYRIKAVTANGATLYGQIRTVFIGDNEIPNWDFQNWSTQTYTVPAGWNLAAKNFNRVQGHSGNYALNLTGNNLAILGFPSEDKLPNQQGLRLLGGIPFTGRPDSLSFYIKGSLTPGDSIAVIIYLHRDSIKVAKNIFYIDANTGGVFKRISLPITYSSLLNPDSLVLGITSVNPTQASAGNENNTITIDDIAFVPPTSAVYNGNFETWFDFPIELPDSWFAPTFLDLDSTHLNRPLVISKTGFGYVDDYAAEVKNIYANGIGLVAGGLGLKFGTFYGDNQPVFPVSAKHYALNGFYKAFPDKGDTLDIDVVMYNQGERIGGHRLYITDTVPDFMPFEIPIQYNYDSLNQSIIPDSADIEMHTHGNTPNRARGYSRLIVDKLHFDGFVSGINDNPVIPSHFDSDGLKVYPNPSNDIMVIEILEVMNSESTIEIYNINGQKQREMKMPAGENKMSFSVTNMEPGFYLLRWVNGSKAANKKIVVVK